MIVTGNSHNIDSQRDDFWILRVCFQYLHEMLQCLKHKIPADRLFSGTTPTTQTNEIASPYCSPLHGSSICQPADCCFPLRSAEQGCWSLVASHLPLMSLSVPHHTAPSGDAASPAGMPHHDSEIEPGTEWQSGSRRASGRTCSTTCPIAASVPWWTEGLTDTFKTNVFLNTVPLIYVVPL